MSFIDNPEGFIAFLDEVNEVCAKGNNVFIDLSRIFRLTSDAPAVLLSKIRDDRFMNEMMYAGNFPGDPDLHDTLEATGFFDHVSKRGSQTKTRTIGQIFERESYKVEADAVHSLIQDANEIVPGDPNFHWDGIQGALVECMNNTNNHAAHRDGDQEKWWLSAYCNEEEDEVHFSFVDNGIGIFESLKRDGWIRRIKEVFSFDNRIELFKALISGKVQSSTGLGYRGRGLPNIVKKLEREQLQGLIVISNDVYANVAEKEFRLMECSFRGTFLFWKHRRE